MPFLHMRKGSVVGSHKNTFFTISIQVNSYLALSRFTYNLSSQAS